MKKRITILAIVLAAAALAAVPFVYAGPGGHRGMGGHGGPHGEGFGGPMIFGHLQHAQEELDLSDAQVDQIKSIFAELHAQNEQYHESMRGGIHDAAALLIANPNDLAGAQALLDKQAAAEKVMKTNMLAAVSKALNVLTADQRAELAQLVKEHSERRELRRDRR